MALTSAQALQIMQKSHAKAAQLGITISTVVVDPAGYPLASLRMDGGRWITTEIARAKAYTATVFRTDTESFAQRMQAMPHFLNAVSALGHTPIAPVGGGLPITIGGEVVGGVGVSGGTAEQDVECAKAGLEGL